MADPGRIAVVLGGGGTIGSAIARRLAGPDTGIVLGYLQDAERARAVATMLERAGSTVRTVEGNIAEPATLERITACVDAFGGRCDQLVHAVAVTSFKPLLAIRPSQWNLILEVSTRSLLDVVSVLLEPLTRAHGTVVAISSQGATRAIPEYGALGPAKGALESVVRQLAYELAARHVRVNAIRAGLIESNVVERFPPGVREAVVARTPFARLGTADEIAAAAGFLLGPESSWIVGQVIEVDGGFALA